VNALQKFGGINITASRLQIIELEIESNHFSVNNVGQTFLSPVINFDDPAEEIIFPQIQNAFEEIKIRNGFNCSFASFTLPPELFLTIQLPYDSNLNQKEIRDEFSWEISQLFPFVPVEELALKFYDLESKFLQGRNNALVVALPKKYLMLLKKFCSINNLQPKLVDNASISANSFINSSRNEINNFIGINLYNSKNSITLFINISSKPAYIKVFNKSDKNLISTIVNELRQERFEKIFNQSQLSGAICGEDIGIDAIAQLEQELNIKFENFDPFNIIKFKDDAHSFEIPLDYYSSFTPAVGVASRYN
jgi:Tfp pilus assembly PilM family ATPase